MPNLPRFKRGQHWDRVRAEEMNELSRRVRDVSSPGRWPGARATVNLAGQWFGLQSPIDRDLRQRPLIRVALVAPPPPDAREGNALTVRQVVHQLHPPDRPEIMWRGFPFVAYPDVGFGPRDFDTLVTRDEAPSLRTETMLARPYNGCYLVSPPSGKPGTQIVPVVVRTYAPLSRATTIDVAPVRKDPATGSWNVSGPTETIFCWPGFEQRHYAKFAVPEGDPAPSEYIKPAVQVDGDWYVIQLPHWNFRVADPLFSFVDCVPPQVGPSDGL